MKFRPHFGSRSALLLGVIGGAALAGLPEAGCAGSSASTASTASTGDTSAGGHGGSSASGTTSSVGGAGGVATPLLGASGPFYEYYPVFAPTDALLAFNRSTTGVMRSDPAAEVFVVPAAGGTATRVAANDPPACTGLASPGLTNSWPRWAPTADIAEGKRYYWLVFSSKRRAGISQLFVSAVVTKIDGSGETIEATYPALHVAAQPGDESNHTPAWTTIPLVTPK